MFQDLTKGLTHDEEDDEAEKEDTDENEEVEEDGADTSAEGLSSSPDDSAEKPREGTPSPVSSASIIRLELILNISVNVHM